MLLEAEVDMFNICNWLDINENLSALQNDKQTRQEMKCAGF